MNLWRAVRRLWERPRPPYEYRHSSGTVVTVDKDGVLLNPGPTGTLVIADKDGVRTEPLERVYGDVPYLPQRDGLKSPAPMRMTGGDRGPAAATVLRLTDEEYAEIMRKATPQ